MLNHNTNIILNLINKEASQSVRQYCNCTQDLLCKNIICIHTIYLFVVKFNNILKEYYVEGIIDRLEFDILSDYYPDLQKILVIQQSILHKIDKLKNFCSKSTIRNNIFSNCHNKIYIIQLYIFSRRNISIYFDNIII